MNFAVQAATWGLNWILPLFNGASLVFYNNPQPSTPETALAATNTALCTFTFASTAFGAPSFSSPNDAATASFVASSVTPGANGTVTFARATLKNSGAWASGATYATLFQIVTSSGNFYVCTKTGTASTTAPSTTTVTPITDGGVQWQYYAGTANNVLADFDVGTSGNAIVIGSTSITTTVQVTMTSFVLQTTAS